MKKGRLCLLALCTASILTVGQTARVVASFSSRQQLWNMAIHSNTGEIMVAATNHLYRLSEGLIEQESVQTGPHKDAARCPPHPNSPCDCPKAFADKKQCANYTRTSTDNINRLLVIDISDNATLSCSTLFQGFCEKFSLYNLSSRTPMYDASLVSRTSNISAIGFIGPAYQLQNALYVAVSTPLPTFLPLLSSRRLDTLEYVHKNSNIKMKMGTSYSVIYKYGFSYNRYSYFISHRDLSGNMGKRNKYGTFISRVCQQDYKFRSLIETPLKCNLGSTVYSVFLAGYVGKAGRELVDKIGKPRSLDDDWLFAVFGTDSRSSGQSSAIMCVYALQDVEDTFMKSQTACHQGVSTAQIGPAFVATERECVFISVAGDASCGQLESNNPITSTIAASPSMRTRLPALASDGLETYTSAVAAMVRNQTVVLLGTTKGNLVKVQLKSTTNSIKYGETELEASGYIHELSDVAQNGTYLLARTHHKVLKVATSDCDSYKQCDTCRKDPYCGWCIESFSCTDEQTCKLSKTYAGWLGDSLPPCPSITAVSPDQMAAFEIKSVQISLVLSFVPSVENNELRCMIEGAGIKIDASAVKTANGLKCNSFTKQPKIKGPEEMTITVLFRAQHWLTAKFTVYECSHYETCMSCTNTTFQCAWCTMEARCEHETRVHNLPNTCSNTVYGQNTVLKETNPNQAEFSGYGPSRCPRVEAANVEQLAPAGITSNITLTGVRLQAHQTNFMCLFKRRHGQPLASRASVTSTSVTSASSSTRWKITCDVPGLSYTGDEPFQNFPVDISWGSDKILDNPQGIYLKVYKCASMVRTCGECLTMEAQYQCGWCAAHCSMQQECPTTWLSRNKTCSGPQITKFSPEAGPVNGGSLLTVEGINLGKVPGDLEVRVAAIVCKVRQDDYQPSTRFVCETEPSNVAKTGRVSVMVSKEFHASTTEKFTYVDPAFGDFHPKKGPVSGGTMVTVSGQYLDIGSIINIYSTRVNSSQVPCDIVYRNGTSLQFRTPRQAEQMLTEFKVTIDGLDSLLPDSFAYVSDPNVTSVEPKTALMSGGTIVQINGTRFDSVQQRKFFVKHGEHIIETDCNLTSAKSMKCRVPGLSGLANGSLRLNYGVIMDGVESLLNLSARVDLDLLTYYPDPQVFHLDGSNKMLNFRKDMKLVIKGKYLDVFLKVPGLSVTVGGTSCYLQDVTTSVITCLPPEKPGKMDSARLAAIFVHHGNFQANVGFLKYSGTNVLLIIGVVLGVLIPIILLLCIACVCLRKKRRSRKKNRIYKVNYSKNARMGPTLEPEMTPLRETGAERNGQTVVPAEASKAAQSDTMEKQVVGEDHSPDDEGTNIYTPRYLHDLVNNIKDDKLKVLLQEVLIPKIRLDLGEIIGKGHFGCVYRGELYDESNSNPEEVAVKTLQGSVFDQNTVESFLQEGVMMKNFDHPHVLRLLGVCIEPDHFPMVVLPFMAGGDLRTYVKDKSKNFTARQLMSLAQQVAQGMAYLSNRSFVHRDLAARNCMINEDSVVKVADFGLSRDLYEKDYYSSKDRKRKMPIKWMAIESLEEYVFNTSTDVWSFGVLMWELMTRGVTPYPDVDVFDMRNYLTKGHRLRQPKHCPDVVYKIMLDCWSDTPELRPTFADLVNSLELLVNPPKKRQQSEASEPLYMNVDKLHGSAEYLEPTLVSEA